MSTDTTPTSSGTVAPVRDVRVVPTANALRQIQDIDDAFTVLADTYGADVVVEEAPDAIGDGFSVTKDKDQFCQVRAVIVNFAFSEGDYEKDDGTGEKGEFVTVWIVTVAGKFKFADGSTGIYRQLRDYFDRTGKTFLILPNGLRKSNYTTKDEKGRDIPATTFYIDTTRA